MSTIRKATALKYRDEIDRRDVAAIRQLVAGTGYFSGAEVDVAEELAQERLDKGPGSGYEFVLAELAGELTGYTCYGEIPCTLGSFDLYWIAVDRAHQRGGIGTLLLGETERRIRHAGGRHVYVETSGRADYAPTRKFYESRAYEKVAELADFYAPRDSKIIYLRSLR